MLTDPTSCVGADPVDESAPTFTQRSRLSARCHGVKSTPFCVEDSQPRLFVPSNWIV